MGPLDLVRLTPLMSRTKGRRELKVALIDGPVALGHPDLDQSRIEILPTAVHGSCSRLESVACMHGTFVAGMLVAKRGSAAPAICPDCSLIVRPIFPEQHTNGQHAMPSATPAELASAIVDSVNAGANVINLSAALVQSPHTGEDELQEALSFAARRDTLVVAAAGNQGTVGSSAITRHTSVIPVTACDSRGYPLPESNLGGSIGKRGLSAPGEGVTSSGPDGTPLTFGGTSAAAPFVTGAIALLWSEFPTARAADIKLALMQSRRFTRRTVVPPVLDAWSAYESVAAVQNGRGES